MDTVIEVVAAEAVVEMTTATVQALKVFIYKVVNKFSLVATSILRSLLSRGSVSVSAVSPDHILQGGMTVA